MVNRPIDAKPSQRVAVSMSRTAQPAAEPRSAPSALEVGIRCLACDGTNPGAARFCRTCGGSLWKRCLACDQERPVDELFCAQCGQDMARAERALIDRERECLAQVERMTARLELREALAALNELVARAAPVPG